ncbi:MAG: FliM/FliN family flagellar motor switch protein [Acidobacteriota bacterium]
MSSPRPALHPWLSRYARELGARMAVALELPIRLRFDGLSEEYPDGLLGQLEDTGYFCQLRLDGTNDDGLLQVDTNLAGWFVSLLLGGRGGLANLNRELTEVEVEVLRPLAEETVEVLNNSIQELLESRFVAEEVETSTSLAARLCGSGLFAVAELAVSVGNTPAGVMRLCLPSRWASHFERILGRPPELGEQVEPLLPLSELGRLPVRMTVRTSRVTTTAGQVARLQEGVKLRLGEDPSKLIFLETGGVVVAEGRPTITGVHKGLRVDRTRMPA